MFYDEQGGGCQTRCEEEDTFRFDPAGIREVFHMFIAVAVPKSGFGTKSILFTFYPIRVFELFEFGPCCSRTMCPAPQ